MQVTFVLITSRNFRYTCLGYQPLSPKTGNFSFLLYVKAGSRIRILTTGLFNFWQTDPKRSKPIHDTSTQGDNREMTIFAACPGSGKTASIAVRPHIASTRPALGQC